MTTVTHEVQRGARIDYGGEPPAPTGATEQVVQFFDDGSFRTIERSCTLSDIFADWNSAIEAQRAAVAQQSGERAIAVDALTAEVDRLTEALAAMTADRDRWKAEFEQLQSEVEPA